MIRSLFVLPKVACGAFSPLAKGVTFARFTKRTKKTLKALPAGAPEVSRA
jgi:hypothetical protein